jgi:hypothetical protein
MLHGEELVGLHVHHLSLDCVMLMLVEEVGQAITLQLEQVAWVGLQAVGVLLLWEAKEEGEFLVVAL